jgi:hypothetical protein
MSYAYSGDPTGMAGLYHYGSGAVGILGLLVAGSGTNGASPLYDDVQASGWQTNEVRLRIVSTTFPQLSIGEDGSLYHPAVADGTYTITSIVSVDGVDVGPETITINVGSTPLPALLGASDWFLFGAVGSITGAVATTNQVLWRDFVPQMIMTVPDCPVFTIEDAVRQAAVRFYRDMRTWRDYGVTLCVTAAGVDTYEVLPPVDLELSGLPEIFALNMPIDELNPASAADVAGTSTVPRSWKVGVIGPTTIKIVPPPAVPNVVLTATVAYTPAKSCTGIPWDLYRLHKEVIEELALNILTSMQGKPWSNPAAAQDHMNAYTAWSLDVGTKAGAIRTQSRLRIKQY